jgi:pSer/pThr/pTyr-binding forkhead associated (FHA) protein
MVVNPDTPHAWEIQLKPGQNLLGRSDDTDFKIDDASVSSSHCHIIVTNGQATIKDLGSTNGTFVNRARISELSLCNGNRVRLGSVEMLFQAGPKQPAPIARIIPKVAMQNPAAQPPPIPR